MKKLLFITFIIVLSTTANAESVRGHLRKDGTYVQPHYRSAPDNSVYNNYSTRGNSNPYTGQRGYVDPNRQYQYQQPTYNYDNQRQRKQSSYR